MTSSAVLWEVLVRKGKELATTDTLKEMALELEKDPRNAIDHLVRAGYLTPLFKGTYYVRRPEEVRLGTRRYNHLELFALAARVKPLGNWYFGLHTALRLHGMSHEHPTSEEVISDRLYRIEGVSIGGHTFKIHRWSTPVCTFGVTAVNRLPVSDREKTVLDLAYHDLWRLRKSHPPSGEWKEHVDAVSKPRLREYLHHYPPALKTEVLRWT